MYNRAIYFFMAVFFTALCSFTAKAGDAMKTATVDGLRIELHVLPAEPFFTADEIKLKHETEGMLIIGGAKPLAPNAIPNPDCHLVVHIYDTKTDKAIPNAKVSMNVQLLDAKAMPKGPVMEVPVVIMEAIGKGPQSIHYGNNVVLPAGTYVVNVVANGNKTDFHVTLPIETSDTMHKH